MKRPTKKQISNRNKWKWNEEAISGTCHIDDMDGLNFNIMKGQDDNVWWAQVEIDKDFKSSDGAKRACYELARKLGLIL